MVSENGQVSPLQLSPEELKKLDNDLFLSKMSFALGGNCDCDECGDVAPKSITDAVKEHKRMKMMIEKNPEQSRSLICRESGVSIWKWIMPEDAEPLVEYGNSHRFVLVRKLPKNMVVKSVGKGIIGSSQEEKDRSVVTWEENKAYFLPCNGGKALGWKCENNEINNVDKETKEDRPKNNAIVYMFKSTMQSFEVYDGLSESSSSDHSSWDHQILGILRKMADNIINNEVKENKEQQSRQGHLLPADDIEAAKKILHKVEPTP